MQILGNGVDIVENYRIKKAIRKKSFVKRIYSEYEIKEAKKFKNKASFFAKRFAAKEAFVKSIGTGFRNGINFSDIYVKNNPKSGKPIICIKNNVKKLLKRKFKNKKYKFFLSLADEKKHSIAFVIINENNWLYNR